MRQGPIAASLLSTLILTSGATAAGRAQHPVREHVDMTLVKRAGMSKFEHKGRATGTIAGSVRSRITLEHSVVLNGIVTITTASGLARMRIDGRARSLGMRPKITGTAVISGGTGRYAHASGSGTFTGIVNRSTWHVTIDAVGFYRD